MALTETRSMRYARGKTVRYLVANADNVNITVSIIFRLLEKLDTRSGSRLIMESISNYTDEDRQLADPSNANYTIDTVLSFGRQKSATRMFL